MYAYMIFYINKRRSKDCRSPAATWHTHTANTPAAEYIRAPTKASTDCADRPLAERQSHPLIWLRVVLSLSLFVFLSRTRERERERCIIRVYSRAAYPGAAYGCLLCVCVCTRQWQTDGGIGADLHRLLLLQMREILFTPTMWVWREAAVRDEWLYKPFFPASKGFEGRSFFYERWNHVWLFYFWEPNLFENIK